MTKETEYSTSIIFKNISSTESWPDMFGLESPDPACSFKNSSFVFNGKKITAVGFGTT